MGTEQRRQEANYPGNQEPLWAVRLPPCANGLEMEGEHSEENTASCGGGSGRHRLRMGAKREGTATGTRSLDGLCRGWGDTGSLPRARLQLR